MMNDDDDTLLRARINVRGRGTGSLVKGRFERVEAFYGEEEAAQVDTEVFRDTSRTILSTNDSPDLGFSTSLNVYRGCEHGCIYCFARPTHEYLGLSAGLDFETRLFAKADAPQLLRAAFMAKSWQPTPITMSAVTDCYQPIERKLGIARGCLEVMAEFRNPVIIITKNVLVTRDIDLLKQLTEYNGAHVCVSITTLDGDLARRLEPRASRPELRLRAVRELHAAGIPVSVNMAPVIPGLTDHEIPALLKAAAEAGARAAHYVMVRLPYGVKDLFTDWLAEHYPLRKEKVLSRIREVRGGKLYDAQFGTRMKGQGVYADHIRQLFTHHRKACGLDGPSTPLSVAHFRRPSGSSPQLSLF